MLITEILARNARMFPHDLALIEREPSEALRREMTWGAFDAEANRFAHALVSRGLRKGDRVVHLMTNALEWLPIYFGILKTGAWAVPLNFRFEAETILHCCELAEPKAIVFGEEFIERIQAIKPALDRTVAHYIFTGPEALRPAFAESYAEVVSGQPCHAPSARLDLADDAALYFTSGTTGTPKAIVLTHRNLEASCYLENIHHRQTRQDNFLCIPPLYHTGAKMHWFGNFIVGAPTVLLKGVKPRWILEAISEEKVSVVWLLVPWALDLLQAVESGDVRLEDYALDQWRLMHIGAQPVPPSLIRRWQTVFPHHQYDTNYGLTEATGPGCIHLGLENSHKVGAIGRPGFDWEYRIVDENVSAVPRGQTGELMVKGPGVMREYYKNPEATAAVLKDGWLLTGDMAREDDEGFIWLVDRKKDIIITGGENIYPVEIEDFLQEHPDIQDVAVIGLPDERLGEVTAAIIQPIPGRELDEAAMEAFCKALPRYKRPRRFFFGEVPRNPTGKIEKPFLRRRYGGAAESFKV